MTVDVPASSEPYKAAQKYFAASPSPGRLIVSCYPNSESPSQALDALLEKTEDFYGIALADSRTDAEVLALADHLAGLDKPAMLFHALTGTAAVAEGSLWRQRADLTVSLRAEEKETHPARRGVVASAPAVVIRRG